MQDVMQPIGTPDGLFHDGNPATGQLGTIVSALWLNASQGAIRSTQSELLAVLAAAGVGIDPGSTTQVIEAIKKIAWGGTGAARPTTLAGYGIADAYTKTATDSQMAGKANVATTLAGYGITDALGYRGELDSAQINTATNIGIWRVLYSGYSTTLVVSDAGGSVGSVQTEYAHTGLVRWRNKTDGTTWSAWRNLATQATTLAGYGITDGATQASVATAISTASPPGLVALFGIALNTAPPTGWLVADGSAVSRTTYSTLYAAIGTQFGTGNGSTTFNLPDARGVFFRGFDNNRGIDVGRVYGSEQGDALASHTHTPPNQTGIAATVSSSGVKTLGGSSYDVLANVGYTGGGETRPRNIALLACIKF